VAWRYTDGVAVDGWCRDVRRTQNGLPVENGVSASNENFSPVAFFALRRGGAHKPVQQRFML